MGFLFTILTHLLHGVMKLSGLTPQTLEIDHDTLMNIWLPKQTIIHSKGEPIYIPPKKPAVLLLHCFAMDGIFLWFPQVLALANEYSVYVPDLLFFGGSTTRRTGRSAGFQAEVLAKGMEMVGVQKVAVVGLSYGGMVAFEMAKLYPKLVHSMVVSSTVVELTESISRESFKRFNCSSWQELLLPETVEGFKRMINVGAHKLPWIPNFIYRGVFERILMLWGDDDKIFNLEVANVMKTQLGAKTTLEYIKNAGHLVSLEQSFAYNRHLKKFLASSM